MIYCNSLTTFKFKITFQCSLCEVNQALHSDLIIIFFMYPVTKLLLKYQSKYYHKLLNVIKNLNKKVSSQINTILIQYVFAFEMLVNVFIYSYNNKTL